jgi:hypothetical protein
LFNPQNAERFNFLIESCSRGGADSGCSTARGCGSKVITVGTAPASRAAFDDGFHDELMTEMQTVKHAEREHRRARDLSVVGSVKETHKRIRSFGS